MICVWLWILADFKLLPIFCIFQGTKIWPNAQFTSDWMEHWGLKKTPLNTGVNWLLLLSKVCRSSVRQTWLWSILKYSASDTQKYLQTLGIQLSKFPLWLYRKVGLCLSTGTPKRAWVLFRLWGGMSPVLWFWNWFPVYLLIRISLHFLKKENTCCVLTLTNSRGRCCDM